MPRIERRLRNARRGRTRWAAFDGLPGRPAQRFVVLAVALALLLAAPTGLVFAADNADPPAACPPATTAAPAPADENPQPVADEGGNGGGGQVQPEVGQQAGRERRDTPW